MVPQPQIAILIHDEHIKTMHALQSLEMLLRRQGNRRPPDVTAVAVRAILDTVVQVLAADIQCHFSFEENHLFPVLAGQGDTGITAFLTEEHNSIRPVAREIAALATAALNGTPFTEPAWAYFHEIGTELCEREIYHIQKEEMGLLAAIGMLITAEADARLCQVYRSETATPVSQNSGCGCGCIGA